MTSGTSQILDILKLTVVNSIMAFKTDTRSCAFSAVYKLSINEKLCSTENPIVVPPIQTDCTKSIAEGNH